MLKLAGDSAVDQKTAFVPTFVHSWPFACPFADEEHGHNHCSTKSREALHEGLKAVLR